MDIILGVVVCDIIDISFRFLDVVCWRLRVFEWTKSPHFLINLLLIFASKGTNYLVFVCNVEKYS